MEKYKSFYGILLIIIILLNFVSVCATNSGSKKSKDTDGSVDSGSNTKTKSGDETPKPSEGGAPPASPSEGGNSSSSPGSPSASPPEGAPEAPSSTSPPKGGASPPEGGAPGAPSASLPKGGASPPEGGTPSTSSPDETTPGGGNNATILAYVLFSNTPGTTTVGRPEVRGLISLYQPPNGNTVITGHIGAILNRVNGNYKFTIKDGDGTIFYDCTGRVNPLFIGQASLFSFTWNEIKLSGPNTAIGKHFDIEESGGTLVNGLIVGEFDLP